MIYNMIHSIMSCKVKCRTGFEFKLVDDNKDIIDCLDKY